MNTISITRTSILQMQYYIYVCIKVPTIKEQNHLIYYYVKEKQSIQIFDPTNGKIVKKIKPKFKILEFYFCKDARFIIFQYPRHFAIKDIIQNEEYYQGQIIDQQDNELLVLNENQCLMNVNERKLIKINQSTFFLAFIGKLVIAKQELFFVFTTINRQLMKFLQKDKKHYDVNKDHLRFVSYKSNSFLILYQEKQSRLINYYQRLNNMVKSIRKIKMNNISQEKDINSFGKYFIVFLNNQGNLEAVNIVQATSKIITKNTEEEFFITKGDELYIFKYNEYQFIVQRQKL